MNSLSIVGAYAFLNDRFSGSSATAASQSSGFQYAVLVKIELNFALSFFLPFFPCMLLVLVHLVSY